MGIGLHDLDPMTRSIESFSETIMPYVGEQLGYYRQGYGDVELDEIIIGSFGLGVPSVAKTYYAFMSGDIPGVYRNILTTLMSVGMLYGLYSGLHRWDMYRWATGHRYVKPQRLPFRHFTYGTSWALRQIYMRLLPLPTILYLHYLDYEESQENPERYLDRDYKTPV